MRCQTCEHVKRERLDFLADNPFYTKRFAYYVGRRRCRQATIKDIAKELRLHWETVKTLEMQYMRAQLAGVGAPGPKTIGIDEISVRKGHTYRIVVSDLMRRRSIWFRGARYSLSSTWAVTLGSWLTRLRFSHFSISTAVNTTLAAARVSATSATLNASVLKTRFRAGT